MPEEYFDVALINHDKHILHGRATVGFDEFRVRREAYVEQVLTQEQAAQYQAMLARHHIEKDELLASFVDRSILSPSAE